MKYIAHHGYGYNGEGRGSGYVLSIGELDDNQLKKFLEYFEHEANRIAEKNKDRESWEPYIPISYVKLHSDWEPSEEYLKNIGWYYDLHNGLADGPDFAVSDVYIKIIPETLTITGIPKDCKEEYYDFLAKLVRSEGIKLSEMEESLRCCFKVAEMIRTRPTMQSSAGTPSLPTASVFPINADDNVTGTNSTGEAELKEQLTKNNGQQPKRSTKGGRQKDARTEWVQKKFREGLTPANILDTWDDKSDDKRKAIDPNNHRLFVSVKIKDEEKRKEAREKALGLIEKKRPDDVKRKRK